MKMKVKVRHVVLSLVCLVLGFILAFSYSIANSERKEGTRITDGQWEREDELRSQLIDHQEKNSELQKEIFDKQQKVVDIEKELSQEKQIYFNLAEDTEKYRMFLGKVKVEGPGVSVTLSDSQYNPDDPNVNNYIVHEHHVFKVINELYIAGASAVAINGQRLKHDSYILCTGPVITVDGVASAAPFEITAIGDTEVLASALNLTGGVKDQLVNDNIDFSLRKESKLILEPVISES
ncbi:DUF881 domain-containing protein [Rossellomorea vietnamensis]|uniref:DUF881 domain-containing protein n=2 Tax=Rossellomorea TaxID=2837508 RepID=A0A5D4KL93_9BACI|nr:MULTISPECIES: DUF881 domain-containing protein [Rossellomorea]TYR77609.1 DUF881 domain-containing protein [Rossellomorea vietnamensis]TYS77159.1 DUF881 domain-containing protein [Rossellomorea aquimaris]